MISKKMLTTLVGMMSINYIAYLIFQDKLDTVHKIELYSLLVATQGALAGIHNLLQGKIDKIEVGKNG